MAQSNYRQLLIDFIKREARPPDKFGHQVRLYALTRALGEGLEYDDDVVFAAAWLHDLGVFIGHRPEEPVALAKWDHILYVNEKAPALLRELGFPPAKIPSVLEVIRTHLPSTKPTCVEGSLLRDADILEQLGAATILRTVSKVGRDTRFILFTDALKVLRRNLTELPALLELPRSRVMAQPRIESLRAFLEAAEAESSDWS